MSKAFSAATLIGALLLAGCATTRPPAPPVGTERVLPWGAVPTGPDTLTERTSLEDSLDDGLERLIERVAAQSPGAPASYRILALSGGGSRGAFGAGFLTGWTETGTRPEFDVVTAISTGALMATFAFLGPDYDDRLLVYTRVGKNDIYIERSALQALGLPSIHDTAPLRVLIAELVDEPVLDAVAREHAAGRRLYVGTTNLESGRFTIWDLGAIAASERPDRLQRYRDVLLAAAAFPVMFPPVYIPVEIGGETYHEAHVDGAARAAVFARVFMLDVEDALQRSGLTDEKLRGTLYIILNSQPTVSSYRALEPRVSSVAERSVNTMLDGITNYSGGALLHMAMFTGADARGTWIPSTFPLSGSPLEFDTTEMRRLFELGRQIARSDRPFLVEIDTPEDPVELLELIDPDESFDYDARRYELDAGY